MLFSEKIAIEKVPFTRQAISTLQINLGKLCNQTCSHCHVDAGPHRKIENMHSSTVEQLFKVADATPSLKIIDLTGGAPELNPNFRTIVKHFRSNGLEVIDRCNLTVLFESQQEDLAAFLAAEQVHIIASLPCYEEENVNRQRGEGVFERSIRGLKLLNQLGYGAGSLKLDLVYNPVGPTLPPPQAALEKAYKDQLWSNHGIRFSRLLTITNMPIKRFLVDLRRQRREQEYRDLLERSFTPAAAERVMCRSLLSVSWDGRVFDCDFNQMIDDGRDSRPHIKSLKSFDELLARPIWTDNHCFGCTAGAGSSCAGSLV